VLSDAEAPLDAAAEDAVADMETQADDEEEQTADSAGPRSQGLVASGAQDDTV
jgi:hypothetical protein